jgi:hypothetical protein
VFPIETDVEMRPQTQNNLKPNIWHSLKHIHVGRKEESIETRAKYQFASVFKTSVLLVLLYMSTVWDVPSHPFSELCWDPQGMETLVLMNKLVQLWKAAQCLGNKGSAGDSAWYSTCLTYTRSQVYSPAPQKTRKIRRVRVNRISFHLEKRFKWLWKKRTIVFTQKNRGIKHWGNKASRICFVSSFVFQNWGLTPGSRRAYLQPFLFVFVCVCVCVCVCVWYWGLKVAYTLSHSTRPFLWRVFLR